MARRFVADRDRWVWCDADPVAALKKLGAKIHQCRALRFQESKSNSAMQLVFSNEQCQRLQ